jgi:hypothetical protein
LNVRRIFITMIALALLVAGVAFGSTASGNRAVRIREFANKWLGTPYLWGGDGKGGIDCSAYAREMYREIFGVELPRTTKDQINLGIDLPVAASNPEKNWEPGDLILYVDRSGVPNHVVIYMGGSQLTQSVSGRGVVIDPMKHLWGRRIVARRLLVPSTRGKSGFGPIPAAGPIVPREVPCPPEVTARPLEVKRFASKPIQDMRVLGERDICDFRALGVALEKSGDIGKKNAAQLFAHAEWLESIDALKGEIGRGW